MTTQEFERCRALINSALQEVTTRLEWCGQSAPADGMFIYLVPLPHDPNVSGALFAVDEEDPLNIRLYLTLPLNASTSLIGKATEFVARNGYGRRFGALELDIDNRNLRVRIDTDATEQTLTAAIERLIDRALTIAREVSPGWRQLCTEEPRHDGAAEY